MSVQGPSACGYIPTFTNPIPIYGKIESTALWSEVIDQRLCVLRSLKEKLSRSDVSSQAMVTVIHLDEEIFDKTTQQKRTGDLIVCNSLRTL